MARTRYIKPALFLDEELAELPIVARYFFIGLWTQADREGRLEDRPKSLKAQLLPWDDADADKLLSALAPKFVRRYSGSDGKRYLWIVRFAKHQNPHRKEAPSAIPPPPDSPGTSDVSPGVSQASSGNSGPGPMGNGEWGTSNGEPLTASAEAKRLTARLAELMRENDPKAKVPVDLSKWTADADKLLRLDGRTLDEGLRVLEWCQRDPFWKANVLSMAKFREKFPALLLKMGEKRSNGANAPIPADRRAYAEQQIA